MDQQNESLGVKNVEFKCKYVSLTKFNNICRACLSEGEMKSLFKYDTKILTLYEKHTSVLIDDNDKLPKNICSVCIDHLLQIDDFLQKCQQSEQYLHDILKQAEVQDDTKIEEMLLDYVSDGHHANDNYSQNSDSEDVKLSELMECINKTQIKTEKKVNPKLRKSLTPGPPFVCQMCQQSYSELRKLREHYRQNNVCRPREYSCNLCIKAFYRKNKLQEHMRSHTKETPYKCKICYKMFRFPQNLTRHKKSHSGERPFTCTICGKGFTRSLTKEEHMRTHTGETPFICIYCGKQFKRYSSHYLHIIRHKKDGGEIMKNSAEQAECDICSKTFSSKWTLKTHELTHTGEKKYLCNDCGKDFTTKGALQSHTITHVGVKPYVCPTCSKRFSHKCSLKKHILIHTGEKPYTCKICLKAFVQSTHLKQHLKTHSGERPYICSYCGKSFALNCNLKVHTRIHTGETPHHCPVCNMGFYDSSSMKKHRKAHGEVNIQITVRN